MDQASNVVRRSPRLADQRVLATSGAWSTRTCDIVVYAVVTVDEPMRMRKMGDEKVATSGMFCTIQEAAVRSTPEASSQ